MEWSDYTDEACRNSFVISVRARISIFHFVWLLHVKKKSQWSAGASQTDYSTSLQEMQYTQIQQAASFPPLISPVHTVLKGRTLLLQCGGKRRASGTGREGCRGRDGKLSLVCVLLASHFQASVPQQLSEERQIKVRRDAPPQESTRLVDLFLGAPCKTFTMSVGGSDVKLESCFRISLFSTPVWL